MTGPAIPASERIRLARERMDRAKLQFTEAARATLRRDPNAPELAQAAFREVSEARDELRALDVGAGT